jgi:CheY-like chemotaxis protein
LLDSTVPSAGFTRIARSLPNGGHVEENSRIRVLIVDDHSVVRMGLRVFFDLQDDIEVVGEAADGSEAAGAAGAPGFDVDGAVRDVAV